MFDAKFPFSWSKMLQSEIEKPYFGALLENVAAEYENNICFPPADNIFAAFEHCTFDDVKIVIIGQDPYHGIGEANGLCFSVNDSVRIPPSLRNIFREINDDFERIILPNSGNLERWAQQGILLLNNTLTVRIDQPNSHKHLDWTIFTDAVIEVIATQKQNIVFMLWGNFAIKKGKKIDVDKHLVLTSGHPSPMSANQGKWFGNKHFSLANDYLKLNHESEIDW